MPSDKKRDQNQRDQRENEDQSEHDSESRPPNFFQVIQSTLAAAFGVQTEKARKRDFTHGRPMPFIIAGIVFTVLLIGGLVLLVNVILRSAGA